MLQHGQRCWWQIQQTPSHSTLVFFFVQFFFVMAWRVCIWTIRIVAYVYLLICCFLFSFCSSSTYHNREVSPLLRWCIDTCASIYSKNSLQMRCIVVCSNKNWLISLFSLVNRVLPSRYFLSCIYYINDANCEIVYLIIVHFTCLCKCFSRYA